MSIRINGSDRESTINETSASSIGIGAYHLADNPNLYEIQRSNNFEFVVTDLNGILKAGTDDTIPNAEDVIRVSCKGAPVPHFSQPPIEVRRGNSSVKYAGVPTFSSGNIVLNDYIGAGTVDALEAWQNLSYNVNTEKVGLVGDYKKDCYLLQYTPDQQLIRSWKLRGCWISDIREDDFDSDSNSKRLITATVQYDSAILDYDYAV